MSLIIIWSLMVVIRHIESIPLTTKVKQKLLLSFLSFYVFQYPLLQLFLFHRLLLLCSFCSLPSSSSIRCLKHLHLSVLWGILGNVVQVTTDILWGALEAMCGVYWTSQGMYNPSTTCPLVIQQHVSGGRSSNQNLWKSDTYSLI